MLAVAGEAESAYFRYVSARQVAALRQQIAKAGTLSATLATRYHDAGNISARELAMELAAAAAARLDALQSDADAVAARTALAAVLGLSTAESWDAPAELPVPLAREDDLDALLTRAGASRLDLAAARTRAAVLADRLGVVNWTRWLGELNAGVERERETDGAHLTGATLDWEVPIFNQHRDSVLRADADMQIAVAEVRSLTIDIDNGVRLAHAAVQNARARIREYQDALIPP